MATVEEILSAFDRLGAFAEEAAKRAAPLVEEALRSTAAAGTAPDGTPWQPLKKGGGQAYRDAAKGITVKAFGLTIRATLKGHAVFGHYGGGRNPRRPVLPDPGTIPPHVARALERAADQAFAEATR